MSVYRELAGELQAARAHANVLRSKNQQLQAHNLALRQEIERLATATDRARALAERSERESGQQVVSLPMPRLAPEEDDPPASPPSPPSLAAAADGEAAETGGKKRLGLAALAIAIAILFSGLGFAAMRALTTSDPIYPQQRR